MAATLDLTSLTSSEATMPERQTGREATPLPDNIVADVKRSYDLPKGKGLTIKVPNGEKTEKGNDANVARVVGILRRAAESLGYGISISIGEPNSRTTPVLYRAKVKSNRSRRTRAQIIEDTYNEWVTHFILNPEEALPDDAADADEDHPIIRAWDLTHDEEGAFVMPEGYSEDGVRLDAEGSDDEQPAEESSDSAEDTSAA